MEKEILIRTDIIDPHIFLDIELKYKNLIEVIYKCGGYVLYSQIYKFFNNKSKAYREIKKMENILLVGSEQFNNNKYIYLKITSQKYLNHKKNIKKTNIARLLKNPGYKTLMNSFYSFEHYLITKKIINTELSVSNLINFIEIIKIKLNENRIKNIHLLPVEKENFTEIMITKLKIYGERNGIYLTEIDQESLNLLFIVFDFDEGTNIVLKTIKKLNEFLSFFGKKNNRSIFNFRIKFITLSKERSIEINNLINLFIKRYEMENFGFKSAEILIHEDIEKYLKITCKGDDENMYLTKNNFERLKYLNEII